ncbi:MAG: hypothetical protein FWC00_05645 [Firmicutes bacterium]|nr:hypothetical protein [Bacillota bacterium]
MALKDLIQKVEIAISEKTGIPSKLREKYEAEAKHIPHLAKLNMLEAKATVHAIEFATLIAKKFQEKYKGNKDAELSEHFEQDSTALKQFALEQMELNYQIVVSAGDMKPMDLVCMFQKNATIQSAGEALKVHDEVLEDYMVLPQPTSEVKKVSREYESYGTGDTIKDDPVIGSNVNWIVRKIISNIGSNKNYIPDDEMERVTKFFGDKDVAKDLLNQFYGLGTGKPYNGEMSSFQSHYLNGGMRFNMEYPHSKEIESLIVAQSEKVFEQYSRERQLEKPPIVIE